MKKLITLLIVLYSFTGTAVTFGETGEAPADNPPITAWPILYQRTTKETKITDILWPVFHHEKSDKKEVFSVRPFIYSFEKEGVDNRKISVLGPLNTYSRTKESTWFHSFPFYWYGRSPSESHTVLFPIYWNLRTKTSDIDHLWPLFGRHKTESFTEFSTLYPFFRYKKETKKKGFAVDAFWPLFRYQKTEDQIANRFLPLYGFSKSEKASKGFVLPYFWQKTPDRNLRGILPFWLKSEAPDQNINIAFPLYFHWEDPSVDLRLITPFYADLKSNNARLKTLFPLYYTVERNEAELSLLLPFYFGFRHEQVRFKTAFPLYYSLKDDAKATSFTYFFPFYGTYRKKDHTARRFLFFPVYSNYRDTESGYSSHDVLWPLFHYGASEEEKSIWALPFYTHIDRPDYRLTSAFPFYFSFRNQTTAYQHLLPFYGNYSKGSYSKQFFLGPVFINTKESATGFRAKDILFPLARFQSRGDDHLQWIFPLYLNSKTDNRSITTIFPFYLKNKTEVDDLSIMLLPPSVSYRSQDLSVLHCWPFFGKLKKGDYTEYASLWPLLRYGSAPDDTKRTVQVFNWVYSKSEKRSYNLLFPIWHHDATPESTKDISLFLHSYTRDEKTKETDFSLLWLVPGELSLFHLQKSPGKIQHSLFPFYRYQSDKNAGSVDFQLLWPLFNSSKEGEFEKTVSMLSGLVSYNKSGPQQSEFRFMWRFVRYEKTERSKTFELNPFYYRHTDRETGSYWAVLGGLLGRQKRPDGSTDYKFFWVF